MNRATVAVQLLISLGTVFTSLALSSKIPSSITFRRRPRSGTTGDTGIDSYDLVNQLNAKRASFGSSTMRCLTWNDKLERKAQELADDCSGSHHPDPPSVDGYTPAGEAVMAMKNGAHSGFPTSSQIVAKLFDKSQFSYESNSCQDYETGGCQNFRQGAWAPASEVGCASAQCSTVGGGQGGYVIVCLFNQKEKSYQVPYKKGSACSCCGGSFQQCENGLCCGGSADSGDPNDSLEPFKECSSTTTTTTSSSTRSTSTTSSTSSTTTTSTSTTTTITTTATTTITSTTTITPSTIITSSSSSTSTTTETTSTSTTTSSAPTTSSSTTVPPTTTTTPVPTTSTTAIPDTTTIEDTTSTTSIPTSTSTSSAFSTTTEQIQTTTSTIAPTTTDEISTTVGPTTAIFTTTISVDLTTTTVEATSTNTPTDSSSSTTVATTTTELTTEAEETVVVTTPTTTAAISTTTERSPTEESTMDPTPITTEPGTTYQEDPESTSVKPTEPWQGTTTMAQPETITEDPTDPTTKKPPLVSSKAPTTRLQNRVTVTTIKPAKLVQEDNPDPVETTKRVVIKRPTTTAKTRAKTTEKPPPRTTKLKTVPSTTQPTNKKRCEHRTRKFAPMEVKLEVKLGKGAKAKRLLSKAVRLASAKTRKRRYLPRVPTETLDDTLGDYPSYPIPNSLSSPTIERVRRKVLKKHQANKAAAENKKKNSQASDNSQTISKLKNLPQKKNSVKKKSLHKSQQRSGLPPCKGHWVSPKHDSISIKVKKAGAPAKQWSRKIK